MLRWISTSLRWMLCLMAPLPALAFGTGVDLPYSYSPPIYTTAWIYANTTLPASVALQTQETSTPPATHPQRTSLGKMIRLFGLVEMGDQGFGRLKGEQGALQYHDVHSVQFNSPLNPPFLKIKFASGEPFLQQQLP